MTTALIDIGKLLKNCYKLCQVSSMTGSICDQVINLNIANIFVLNVVYFLRLLHIFKCASD